MSKICEKCSAKLLEIFNEAARTKFATMAFQGNDEAASRAADLAGIEAVTAYILARDGCRTQIEGVSAALHDHIDEEGAL